MRNVLQFFYLSILTLLYPLLFIRKSQLHGFVSEPFLGLVALVVDEVDLVEEESRVEKRETHVTE